MDDSHWHYCARSRTTFHAGSIEVHVGLGADFAVRSCSIERSSAERLGLVACRLDSKLSRLCRSTLARHPLQKFAHRQEQRSGCRHGVELRAVSTSD